MAIWAALIGGAVSLYANKRARDQSNDANQQAQVANTTALTSNQAAIDQARMDAKPGRDYFMRVAAQGPELTPAQRQYADDVRQQTGEELSSRLGGRSATAIATRAAENVRNNTIEANRQRADTAALSLANPDISGVNLSLAAGRANADAAQNSAQIAQATGDANAANTLATGRIIGQGIGSYYANKSNQDLLDAIRAESNTARKSAYSTTGTTP